MPSNPELYKPPTPKAMLRHAVKPKDSRQQRAISYTSPQWQSLRKQVWVRDSGICQLCSKVIIGSFHVDHINNDAMNNTLDNLQLAHPSCHSRKTARETGGFQKGAAAT